MTTITLEDLKMEDSYKILIFYILKKITEPELRKNIWNNILSYEKEILEELINQEWYEFQINQHDEERLTDTDLEIYYTD